MLPFKQVIRGFNLISEILRFYALFCVQIWTCFSIKIKLRLFCEKKEKKRKKKIHTKNILDPVLAFKDFPGVFQFLQSKLSDWNQDTMPKNTILALISLFWYFQLDEGKRQNLWDTKFHSAPLNVDPSIRLGFCVFSFINSLRFSLTRKTDKNHV